MTAILSNWAIPEKIQTGGWGGGEDMEFRRVLNKYNVKIPGDNYKRSGTSSQE